MVRSTVPALQVLCPLSTNYGLTGAVDVAQGRSIRSALLRFLDNRVQDAHTYVCYVVTSDGVNDDVDLLDGTPPLGRVGRIADFGCDCVVVSMFRSVGCPSDIHNEMFVKTVQSVSEAMPPAYLVHFLRRSYRICNDPTPPSPTHFLRLPASSLTLRIEWCPRPHDQPERGLERLWLIEMVW